MKNLDLKNGVIIADGAMGTRIMKLGVNLKETPSELLNIKKPELIEKIHREYIAVSYTHLIKLVGIGAVKA